MFKATILLGSNINPEENLRQAIALLKCDLQITGLSSIWETSAVGSEGPNFLNMAVSIQTTLDVNQLKLQILRSIEKLLGRVRLENKNAARTIDLDIIVYDGLVLDDNLWRYAHIAVPVSELEPKLVHIPFGTQLADIAHNLMQHTNITQRPELEF